MNQKYSIYYLLIFTLNLIIFTGYWFSFFYADSTPVGHWSDYLFWILFLSFQAFWLGLHFYYFKKFKTQKAYRGHFWLHIFKTALAGLFCIPYLGTYLSMLFAPGALLFFPIYWRGSWIEKYFSYSIDYNYMVRIFALFGVINLIIALMPRLTKWYQEKEVTSP